MSTETSPSEAELRAYEDELKKITSSQLLLQASASLLNLAGRRLGLAEGSEPERDLEQVCDAIDAIKALLPILERRMSPQQVRPLRDALSQLQMAYARLAQPSSSGEPKAAATSPGASASEPAERGSQPPPEQGSHPPADDGEAPSTEPGPAERSGRLWVPGR
jgi:hypothetical protein